VEASIEMDQQIVISHSISRDFSQYQSQSSSGRQMSGDIPAGLSPSYWRPWNPRTGLSVNESLESGEEWIGQWDGVGLYEQYVISPPPLMLYSSPMNQY
jgi:hypothetical protein